MAKKNSKEVLDEVNAEEKAAVGAAENNAKRKKADNAKKASKKVKAAKTTEGKKSRIKEKEKHFLAFFTYIVLNMLRGAFFEIFSKSTVSFGRKRVPAKIHRGRLRGEAYSD